MTSSPNIMIWRNRWKKSRPPAIIRLANDHQTFFGRCPAIGINMTEPVISPNWLLTIYCALLLLASLAGGWLLLIIHPTHARLQMAISFVAGLMLGIALLHFLPDAAEQFHSLDRTVAWVLGGFLAMFFLQRFFHFHHHDLPEGDPEDCCHHEHAAPDDHGHEYHAHTLAEKSA